MASPALAERSQTEADKARLAAGRNPSSPEAGAPPSDFDENQNAAVRAQVQQLIDEGILPPPSGPGEPIDSKPYLLKAIATLRTSGAADKGTLDALEFTLDPPQPASPDMDPQQTLATYAASHPHLVPFLQASGGMIGPGGKPVPQTGEQNKLHDVISVQDKALQTYKANPTPENWAALERQTGKLVEAVQAADDPIGFHHVAKMIGGKGELLDPNTGLEVKAPAGAGPMFDSGEGAAAPAGGMASMKSGVPPAKPPPGEPVVGDPASFSGTPEATADVDLSGGAGGYGPVADADIDDFLTAKEGYTGNPFRQKILSRLSPEQKAAYEKGLQSPAGSVERRLAWREMYSPSAPQRDPSYQGPAGGQQTAASPPRESTEISPESAAIRKAMDRVKNGELVTRSFGEPGTPLKVGPLSAEGRAALLPSYNTEAMPGQAAAQKELLRAEGATTALAGDSSLPELALQDSSIEAGAARSALTGEAEAAGGAAARSAARGIRVGGPLAALALAAGGVIIGGTIGNRLTAQRLIESIRKRQAMTRHLPDPEIPGGVLLEPEVDTTIPASPEHAAVRKAITRFRPLAPGRTAEDEANLDKSLAEGIAASRAEGVEPVSPEAGAARKALGTVAPAIISNTQVRKLWSTLTPEERDAALRDAKASRDASHSYTLDNAP